jgi:hypothetical protein
VWERSLRAAGPGQQVTYALRPAPGQARATGSEGSRPRAGQGSRGPGQGSRFICPARSAATTFTKPSWAAPASQLGGSSRSHTAYPPTPPCAAGLLSPATPDVCLRKTFPTPRRPPQELMLHQHHAPPRSTRVAQLRPLQQPYSSLTAQHSTAQHSTSLTPP